MRHRSPFFAACCIAATALAVLLGGCESSESRAREAYNDYQTASAAGDLRAMGLMQDPEARRKAAEFISSQKPRFTFVCVGSPQQELIASEALKIDGSRGLALCVGAALEFITGTQKRAPLIARRLGLEWAHRLLSNPRRMWKRYLVEGPVIFLLAYRWRRSAA